MLLVATVLALQSFVSPPGGDTIGYWQQRANYRIVAGLDERAEAVRASAELLYVNNSPDTLREMYVHQYLNAFRPGSLWAEADEREGRVRFQHLRDPDHGYERFLAPPTVNGTAVTVEYPYAPDSTVARFVLPRPLAPSDSIRVTFAWEARPSTVTRRQGRRGRHYDFAQWYPRVAVYDRGGWQHNPLRPAGEFYGEFGTFDVTLVVRDDQVIGATGVPIEGDPGYDRVRRGGTVTLRSNVYGQPPPGPDTVQVPPGFRRIRFLANDVHHFGWSASPDYMYEGAMYDGRIGIHVLYRPGNERDWGGGVVVQRTVEALRWLEHVFGRYPYPQVTNLHRLDPGGTEFPMMMMNGSPSQGLILHELAHIYIHGILANNEWRDGWMDEGLASYLTSWSQGLTPQDRRGRIPEVSRQRGYRGRAVLPAPHEAGQIDQFRLVWTGRAEPPGTLAHAFSEFAIYNQMIYSRSSTMFGQLRDVMGDSTFVRFLRTFHERWQFRHVDRAAMQRVAEDVYGRPLGWFFDQWVEDVGLLDYDLRRTRIRREGDVWLTRARVTREGEYRHAMPVGVRTSTGWQLERIEPMAEDQWVELRTAERPLEVRLDPFRTTDDWDRRNDITRRAPLDPRTTRFVFDWPFLDQRSRERTIAALTPLAWVSTPGGITGAVRLRTNYQGLVDRLEFGLAASSRVADGPSAMRLVPGVPPSWVEPDPPGRSASSTRFGGWASLENPMFPGAELPAMGMRMGAWVLDGVGKAEMGMRWDRTRFIAAPGPRYTREIVATYTQPYDGFWLDKLRWEDATVADLRVEAGRQSQGPYRFTVRAMVMGGGRWGGGSAVRVENGLMMPTWSQDPDARRGTAGLFTRGEAEARASLLREESGRAELLGRIFLGASARVPLQRSIGVSTDDPVSTFANHWVRPRGGLLAREDMMRAVHRGGQFLSLGGAGLRGYGPMVRAENIASANFEARWAIGHVPPGPIRLQPWFSLFMDIGHALPNGGGDGVTLADIGVGAALRGRIYDRNLALRADFPFVVREGPVTGVRYAGWADEVRLRWTLALTDLW